MLPSDAQEGKDGVRGQRHSKATIIRYLVGAVVGGLLVGSFLLAIWLGLWGMLTGAAMLALVFGIAFVVDQRLSLTTAIDWRRTALADAAVASPVPAVMLVALAISRLFRVYLDSRSMENLFTGGLVVGVLASYLVVSLRARRRGQPDALVDWLMWASLAQLATFAIVGFDDGAKAALASGIVVLALAVIASLLYLALPEETPIAWHAPILAVYAGIGSLFAGLLISLALPTLLHQGHQAADGFILFGILAGGLVAFSFSWPMMRKRQRVLLRAITADLARSQLMREGIWIIPDGRLWGRDPGDIPRVYAVRRSDGRCAAYVRADVPQDACARLKALPPEEAFTDHEIVSRILAEAGAIVEVSRGKTYTVPDIPDSMDLSDVVRLTPSSPGYRDAIWPVPRQRRSRASVSPIFAIMVDGEVVARCMSSLESEATAEACVETLPEYRGRGYARRVVAAWARDLQRHKRIPLFSHDNDAADLEGLARSLGLTLCLEDVAYF